MKMRKILLGVGVIIGCAAMIENTSGLSYQSEADVQFTFNPAMTLYVSNDILLTLAPGTSGSSNAVEVRVTNNSLTGHSLTATVGNATYNTTNLVNSVTGGTFTIVSGDTLLSNFSDNNWGYRIGSMGNNVYGKLPLYSSGSVALLQKVTTDGDFPIYFQIGAKAGSLQTAGDYKNVINFTATANPMPYMQNMNIDQCLATENVVYDGRDGEAYTVMSMPDGKCWMLENLRLDPATLITTINDGNTNLPPNSGDTFILPNSSISWNLGDSYTIPYIYTGAKNTEDTPTSYGKYGVYYNFCVASAGTYCMDSGSANAQYDICPAGWKMPSFDDYMTLKAQFGNDSAFVGALKLPRTGYYSGSLNMNGSAIFLWTSALVNSYQIGSLQASSSSVNGTLSNSGMARNLGLPVRCVLKTS